MANRVSPQTQSRKGVRRGWLDAVHSEIVGVTVCGHSHHPSHLVLNSEPHQARRHPCVSQESRDSRQREAVGLSLW